MLALNDRPQLWHHTNLKAKIAEVGLELGGRLTEHQKQSGSSAVRSPNSRDHSQPLPIHRGIDRSYVNRPQPRAKSSIRSLAAASRSGRGRSARPQLPSWQQFTRPRPVQVPSSHSANRPTDSLCTWLPSPAPTSHASNATGSDCRLLTGSANQGLLASRSLQPTCPITNCLLVSSSYQ